MMGEKVEKPNISELTTKDVNSFTVKVMNEKFEKKWGDKLNESQKSLIRDYIHGKVDESTLSSIKKRALRGLGRLRESTDNQILMEKLDNVKSVVEAADTSKLDDDGIVKFMQITHLYQELEAENE
jgi:hypothetical protein